jgi:hypothetical protein
MLRGDITYLDQERLERSGRGDLEASVEERGGDLLEKRAGLTEAGLGRSVTKKDDMVEDFGRQVGYRRKLVGRRGGRRRDRSVENGQSVSSLIQRGRRSIGIKSVSNGTLLSISHIRRGREEMAKAPAGAHTSSSSSPDPLSLSASSSVIATMMGQNPTLRGE